MESSTELLVIGDGPGAQEAAAAAAARGVPCAHVVPREVAGGGAHEPGWPWPFAAEAPGPAQPAPPRAFLGGGGGVFVEGPDGVRRTSPRRVLLAPRLRPARPSWWEGPARLVRPGQAGPARVIVLGGGHTGVEVAAAWAADGREVLLIEGADRLLPGWDPDQAAASRAALEAAGVTVMAGLRAVACAVGGEGAGVVLRAAGVADRQLAADLVVPALGWRPVLGGCGLERTRALVDRHGHVEADSRCETAEPGLHAIGAALALPLSRGAVVRQAALVAAVAAGDRPAPLRHALSPRLVRRPVPLLAAGLSAAGAGARGIRAGLGRAQAADGTWIRCVTDLESGAIIGVQAAGPRAEGFLPLVALALGLCAATEVTSEACRPDVVEAEGDPELAGLLEAARTGGVAAGAERG